MIIPEKRKIADDDVSPKMAQRSPVKKKLEKEIQKEICEWLHSKGVFFWRQNNVPIFQRDNRGARFRAMPKYALRGLPDIMCIRDGWFIGLEVKVPDYWKYTDDQQNIKEKMIANGAKYHLVTSLDETIECMKLYGI